MIICAFWVTVIIEIIELISVSLVSIVSMVVDYNNIPLENMVAALLTLGFVSIVGVLLGKISDVGMKNVDIKYLIVFTFNLFANFCILASMTYVTLKEMAHKNRIIYTIIYMSVTVGLCIEMASVVLLLISRNRYKEKELIIEQYLEKQVTYYEYLREREKETKKFRHDIRGHLYFLNQLREEGKNQEFEEYFKDIIDKVDDLGNSINVGNDIVNAVLNKAYAEAKDKDIKMNVSGHFPSQCNISAYNLCTIFFNLLNNAVEAADKAEKREIWVICQYTGKVIIVEIGNYYCKNNQLDKSRLQTTKDDKEYHGWGIKNVEDSVEECKGLMDIEIEDEKFIVSMTLRNEKEDAVK